MSCHDLALHKSSRSTWGTVFITCNDEICTGEAPLPTKTCRTPIKRWFVRIYKYRNLLSRRELLSRPQTTHASTHNKQNNKKLSTTLLLKVNSSYTGPPIPSTPPEVAEFISLQTSAALTTLQPRQDRKAVDIFGGRGPPWPRPVRPLVSHG